MSAVDQFGLMLLGAGLVIAVGTVLVAGGWALTSVPLLFI